MSLLTARVIDVHAHAVLEETFGTAGAFGPELIEDEGLTVFRIGDYRLRGVRYRNSPFMDVDLRIAAMDRHGIDWQLLSPNPLTYFHYIPAVEAASFCRRHNDVLAALVRRYPDRLGAAAALPMQDINRAIEELNHAVKDLGMRAAYIGTDLPFPLDDPRLDRFYEAVVNLDIPLFLHPAPDGIDGPKGKPFLDRFDLDILFGFSAQETYAVCTLLFGGVLHRHPGLDICISHGGGALALIWGRLEQAVRKRAWMPDHLQAEGQMRAQLRNIWYDTHMHDERSLDLLIGRVGTERLVYGTNFAGWDMPEETTDRGDPAAFAENARRLLRADRA